MIRLEVDLEFKLEISINIDDSNLSKFFEYSFVRKKKDSWVL